MGRGWGRCVKVLVEGQVLRAAWGRCCTGAAQHGRQVCVKSPMRKVPVRPAHAAKQKCQQQRAKTGLTNEPATGPTIPSNLMLLEVRRESIAVETKQIAERDSREKAARSRGSAPVEVSAAQSKIGKRSAAKDAVTEQTAQQHIEMRSSLPPNHRQETGRDIEKGCAEKSQRRRLGEVAVGSSVGGKLHCMRD